MNVKRQRKKGSFLIEVLLTVTILTTGLTLIIRSMSSSVRALVYSASYSKAVFALENQMFDTLIQPPLDIPVSGSGQMTEPYESFTYDFDIDRKNTPADAEDLANVSLKVEWGALSKTKNILLQTFIFHSGSAGDDE